MALIACVECKREVSDTAKTCPGCGAKVIKPKKTSAASIFIAGGMLLIIGLSLTRGGDIKAERENAAKPATSAKDEAEFQFGVTGTKLVVASLKNPASFEFVEAGVVEKGALCLTYRATNSFNAVTTEQIAVKRNLKKGEWNKDCGGKTITLMPHIKHAL